MINFEVGNSRFNYRVVGIVLDEDHVLLHRAKMDDFWALPGGRVEMLEPAEDALRREMQEELNAEAYIERLVWVVENFFEYDSKSYHELAFYFLMTFPDDPRLYDKSKPFMAKDEEVDLIFKWYRLDGLEDILLYPAFLKEGLNSIPETIQHIVHTD